MSTVRRFIASSVLGLGLIGAGLMVQPQPVAAAAAPPECELSCKVGSNGWECSVTCKIRIE